MQNQKYVAQTTTKKKCTYTQTARKIQKENKMHENGGQKEGTYYYGY